MNRLHVHRIVSVGAVEDPDNPESDIVFWKRAPTPSGVKSAPTAVGAGRHRAGPSRPAADWGPVLRKIAVAKLDEQRQALDEIAEDQEALRRNIDEMRGTRMRQEMTAEGIADAVAKEAKAMRSRPEFWDKSEAELRAELWKRTPGVKDCYTDAMRDPDGFAKSKTSEHAEAFATMRKWADES